MIFLPYLFIVLLLGGCAFFYEYTSDENRKKQLLYTSIAAFILFFAFRGYLYTDWTTYYTYFEKVEFEDIFDWTFDDNKEHYEPGYALLNIICRSIVPHYLFLQVVIAILDIVLLLRFLKKMRIENMPLALLLFFTFSGLMMMFNLLRNSIAILIFLNSLEYLSARKPLQYFTLCGISILFHFSSLLFIPLYFFLNYRLNRWVYAGCLIVFAAMYLTKISIVLSLLKIVGAGEFLEKSVEAYTERMTMARGGLSIGFLERIMTIALVTIYYGKLKELRPNNAVVLNSLLLYFFAFFCFADFAVFSERISTIFAFSYWIIWSDLLRCFYYENNKKLFISFMIMYCTIRIIPSVQLPVQEYDNILLGFKSYEERIKIFNKTYETKDE